ncbi:MAG: hypothetical protein ACLFQJ_06550 [Campylobacterales bacterium]
MNSHAFSLVNITQDELGRLFSLSLNKALLEIQGRLEHEVRYIDSDELEKLYGIRKSQAAKMRMNNELPYYLIKSKVVYKTCEIEDFLNQNKIEAKEAF